MRHRKHDFGAFLAATLILVGGILTLQNGVVDYFGVTGFGGKQAQVFGWASILFAMAIFVVYLRGNKRD